MSIYLQPIKSFIRKLDFRGNQPPLFVRLIFILFTITVSSTLIAQTGSVEAVPTFNCIGIGWSGSGGAPNIVCTVSYREAGSSSAWKFAYPLWFDSREAGSGSDAARPANEYRGSIVGLKSGTTYEIRLTAGAAFNNFTVTTWSENFPIGSTIPVTDRNDGITITSSGTPGGYILYTPPEGQTATIDVDNNDDNCIYINASYVIIRGLILKGAGEDAIVLGPDAHDVVIENNDISGWGTIGAGSNNQAAIRIKGLSYYAKNVTRIVIQRNRMHNPRDNSNSWDDGGHPLGPNGINFEEAGGNHVIRYNEIYSDTGHYFMDGIGGAENFSFEGFPNANSDIYSNIIRNCYDDAIESEGGDRNVRIWGNFTDSTYTGISCATNSIGPLYIFNNVTNISQRSPTTADIGTIDNEDRGPFNKCGSPDPTVLGGRTYLFHNTILQPVQEGFAHPRGMGGGPVDNGGPVLNVVSRNNIWQTHRPNESGWPSVGEWQSPDNSDNTYDYDLYNGNLVIASVTPHEPHGISGTPVYMNGVPLNGPNLFGYFLTQTSPGVDKGDTLINFNDGFTGTAPDMGAYETGKPPLQFGVNAYLPDNPVTANAGEDITITIPEDSTILQGAGTTATGSITSYTWGIVSGPSTYILGDSSAATTTLSHLGPGVYIFRLIVMNSNGAYAMDDVTVTVICPNPPVNVTIASDATDNTICLGTPVTFHTTSITSGGPSPSYQWKVNGNAVGTNQDSFTTSGLKNGDVVTVVLTSNISLCSVNNPATSNAITMIVNDSPVSVSITSDAANNTICTGTAVTFKATPVNGGPSPVYQWKVNGSPVGTNQDSYTATDLKNGDVITVVLTSDVTPCASGNPATSNAVTMTVNEYVPASVSISSGVLDNTICTGTTITFTATPVNGGASPDYQWLLNDVPVGYHQDFYIANGLVNGDIVKIRMTSSIMCTTGSPAMSNPVTMIVKDYVPVSVSITSDAANNTICKGTPVTFTASAINGGATPVYQWLVNGNPVGVNQPVYTTSDLNNGDLVTAMLTSNVSICTTNNPATSNTISMTVMDFPVGIHIISNAANNTICKGSSVTFITDEVIGAGTAPIYQWYVNENPVGTSIGSYTTSDLQNGDIVKVVLTSDITPCASNNPATSNTITMTVNDYPVSVSIVSDATNNTICAGAPVTFTATAINGGTSPIYQWLLNGNPVGTNQSTYKSSTLNNNDIVSVVLTSGITQCASGSPAISNGITMIVNNNIPVSVSITSNATNNTICAGTSVTFTAIPVNGGLSPAYAWKINDNPVGTNQNTFATATLNNGDVVTVALTSDVTPCATNNPATSNAITMTVNNNLPVSVSILSDAVGNTICPGTPVTFTAVSVNEGSAPVYQWKLNGNPVGTNQNTYANSTLSNNDVVSVLLTSNATPCATGNPAASNAIVMKVNNNLPVSVSIVSDATNNTICAGSSVTFKATALNGGLAPVYEWLLNGSPVGTNADTYTSSTITNNDIVSAVLTSSATPCATGNPATSNAITMTVNPDLPVSVSIVSNAAGNTVCSGTAVTFTATPVNGGTTPVYQWKLNGNSVGTNQATYTTSSLSNGDIVTVVLTSNITPCATGNPATGNAITMTVNNNLPVSVSITSNIAGNTICSGTAVTFTATPVNGGTTPVYQWKLNGNPVGANQNTFTSSALNNNDVVSVVLTSNITPCATGNPAASNAITMTVNNNLPVNVSIISNAAGNTICSGTPVTFTATSTNGGTAPVYQWKLNGNNVGTNQDSYTTTTLNNGDVVSVVLTSNITPCAVGSPATSNTIAMTVNNDLPVSVSIASNASNNTICPGTSVTFTATPVNGGSSPVYQWKLNGNNVGANQDSYATSSLNNGDIITVVMTSNITPCAVGSPATSNAINMTVNTNLPVSVSIASDATNNTICSGTAITFTATPVNGGSLPAYQWKLNGNNVGANQATFTTSSLVNGDIVTVVMTSNITPCATGNPAISNAVTITVNNNIPVSVNIVSNAAGNSICSGTSVTFTATAVNGGSLPAYQWKLNGNNVGTNQSTYTTNGLANGDIVSVVLTSDITPCATGNPATSNVISMTVNNNLPVSVSIVSDIPDNTICPGTSVTFTANVVNGGPSPVYQWKLNGNNVGTGLPAYTVNNLSNGDVVSVVLTSDITPCAIGNPAISNAITMTVNNSLPVSVSIISDAPGSSICSGSAVVFTATPVNGGSSPAYQWLLNGNPVGINQNTYTTSSLHNGDVIAVVLASSITTCSTGNPATSNAITMTVNDNLPVSVSIVSDVANNTICSGTNVTFTATPTNGGSSPVYHWKVNGNNAGTNQAIYTTSALNNGDIVTVELISNLTPCVAGNPATSNAIAMTVSNNLPVSVNITSDAADNTTCPGTNVVFTAIAVNGGTSPVYQWKVNGNPVGANQNTYTTASLNNGDAVAVVLTSNAEPCATGNPATSNIITMNVNDNLPVSVSIVSNATNNTTCTGTNVTFTATPVNGGSSPTYQWKLNGNNIGGNQNIYTTNDLINGDIVTVILTSNITTCATGSPATSNAIAMTVNDNLPVSVSITSDAANNTICQGTPVTFTATPVNGGGSPVYQWKLNGNNVGGNQDTYSTASLANGDIISVVLTSNITTCATGNPAVSNAVVMTVNNNLPVSVSIVSDAANNTTCPGTAVLFTATPVNGGSSPTYQWKLNGNNVGANQNTYTASNLANGDVVTVELISDINPCATGNPATSNAIMMNVNSNVPVSVNIASNASNNTICAGTSVTFTATPTNGGASPSYQWLLNGNTVGDNQITFTTSSLNNVDAVTVVMTSSITACASGNPASSNTVVMTVNNNVPVSVSITSDAANNVICAGTSVTFTATPVNGGSSPAYQWKLNGNNVGNNQDTYSTTNLSNGDVVTVAMTSNIIACATGNPATSNSIVTTVNNNLPVSVSIASDAAGNTICPGTTVTFTAIPVNGGSAPIYQWMLNNNPVGANQNTFTSSSFNNGDVVTVVLTSNITTCVTGNPAVSNAIVLTVSNNIPVSVSIVSNAANNTICQGMAVTFMATPVNGGSSPAYQWKVNGNNVGSNQDTYTTSSLNNGDIVTVEITSDITACATGNPATSNTINMVVNDNLPVSVSIVSDAPGNTICSGTQVTFTATPVNGGSSPVYQWKVNGNNVGSNQSVYSSSTLNNNDIVTVVMISSITSCVSGSPATSNAINVVVNNILPVNVSITSDASNNTICPGTSVTFTAVATNGGSSPVYLWKLNGNPVGTNQATYTTSSLNNGDMVTVELTSGITACTTGSPATSNAISMIVNDNLPVSVSIASNAVNNTICSGTPVTFTATPINGGASPAYQWNINGNNVGSNQNTYTTSSLNNGDIVTVLLTSSIAPCATGNPATSNAISVVVNNNLAVAVNIVSDAIANTICQGTSVTFTATPVNGGSSPFYQWKINGNNVGNNQNTFTGSLLNNGDVVTVELISNITPCATDNPAISNPIVITVNNNLPVSVGIASNAANNTICPGTSVTFTATPTNGGTSPVYQWKLNGNPVGFNQAIYTTTSLNNGDVVSVVMISSIASCAAGNPATSNAISMIVNNNLPVSVSIASDAPGNTICQGTVVKFTATPINGGASPGYQWKLNGNPVGVNQDTYTASSLNNGDIITVVLTSSITSCATGNPATSNAITMLVNNNLPVSVSIASNVSGNVLCKGTSVTFTATPMNGGTLPVYQWKLNGNNVGNNQNTYTTDDLVNSDVITVVLTSNITPCSTGNPAVSNALTMAVRDNTPVSVSISSNATNNTICQATPVTFTATASNGGSSPAYQWKINGDDVAGTQSSYTTSSLNNGDIVTVVLTSNLTGCVIENPATSNRITMTVNNRIPVSVSITSSDADNNIVAGTSVTFKAIPVNGGVSPTYQWLLNGNPVGSNQDTYTTTSLSNGDVVSVIMTSSITQCSTGNTVTSNSIKTTVSAISSNIPPVAHTENDLVLRLPTNTTQLHGNTSFDPDGIIVAYSWKQVSGPGMAVITNASTAIATVSQLIEGIYEFELTVTDNIGASSVKKIRVTVEKQLDQKFSFNVYPNPVSAQLTLLYSDDNYGRFIIKIYNINASLITEVVVDKAQFSVSKTIDVSSYAAGIYIIKLIAPDGTEKCVTKFVKI